MDFVITIALGVYLFVGFLIALIVVLNKEAWGKIESMSYKYPMSVNKPLVIFVITFGWIAMVDVTASVTFKEE